MTNNQLALDFAREVMGWGDDAENGAGILEYEPWGIITTVQRWCDEHGVLLIIGYHRPYPGTKDPYWCVQITNDYSLGTEGGDLSACLMEECIKAERKRIGVKGGEVV